MLEVDRKTRVQLMLWFPLIIAGGIYSGVAVVDYIFDLRALYGLPKATKLHREAAWSNLRNEVGRLLTMQLFLVLGVNGIKRLPAWVMFIEFFGVANYKLFGSYKDRQLRQIVLVHQEAELRYPDQGIEAQQAVIDKKRAKDGTGD
jgi:hypothetical protein